MMTENQNFSPAFAHCALECGSGAAAFASGAAAIRAAEIAHSDARAPRGSKAVALPPHSKSWRVCDTPTSNVSITR